VIAGSVIRGRAEAPRMPLLLLSGARIPASYPEPPFPRSSPIHNAPRPPSVRPKSDPANNGRAYNSPSSILRALMDSGRILSQALRRVADREENAASARFSTLVAKLPPTRDEPRTSSRGVPRCPFFSSYLDDSKPLRHAVPLTGLLTGARKYGVGSHPRASERRQLGDSEVRGRWGGLANPRPWLLSETRDRMREFLAGRLPRPSMRPDLVNLGVGDDPSCRGGQSSP